MDKYRGITRLPLLESRIRHLMGRLDLNYSIGSYVTQEELVRVYADIVRRLDRGIETPIYDLPMVEPGSPVNEGDMNLFLLGVYSEIQYLLKAAHGTGDLAEGNFNFGIARIRRLQAGLKYARQQLSVYSIYTTKFGDALYHGETFSNEVNIDRGSTFLKEDECFLDLAEGTASLPRKEEDGQWDIEEISIGRNSNGVLGNNIEAAAPIRGKLKSMHDSNLDTWTEYERVVDSENSMGLKLSLKISLAALQPVNGIKIHPVFLGARTPFSIDAIEVSRDGGEWINLKEDVRVAAFLDEDLETRYHLSPHASKFAGEFNITFAPRFVKFVRLFLRQTSTFPITDTSGGRRLRYAIGIKEIAIFGHKYDSVGELVSKPIDFTRSLSVAAIEALLDPPLLPEEVGSATFFLSHDDGATWQRVGTISGSDLEIPEVLPLPEGTTSLRWKVRLEKDELAFAQEVEEAVTRPFRQVGPWLDIRPFDILLKHTPEKGSLVVCDPEVTARGWSYPKLPIGRGAWSEVIWDSDSSVWRRNGNTELRLKIPLLSFVEPGSVRGYVGNVMWSRVKSAASFSTRNSKMFYLERADDGTWEMVFGNASADTPKGAIPSSSDEISMLLSTETVPVEGLAAPYTMTLDYPSDGEKTGTEIKFIGKSWSASTTAPQGVVKIDLPHGNLNTGGFTVSIRGGSGWLGHVIDWSSTGSTEPFVNYQTFVDGFSEIQTGGDWTVDFDSGIVYLNDETYATRRYTIAYIHSLNYVLAPADWDFVEGSLQKIQLYESGYRTREGTTSVTSGNRFTILLDGSSAVDGIVPKSVRMPDGVFGTYEPYEVPFVDGYKEFETFGEIQDQEIPAVISTAIGGGLHVAQFRLTHWQNLIADGGISFPTTDPDSATFEVSGEQTFVDGASEFVGDGDWSIDYEGDGTDGKGYVYLCRTSVFTASLSAPSIAYKYRDDFSYERMRGAFSVDLKRARVHYAIDASSVSGSITFRYAKYSVRYNVSAELEEGTGYTVDYERPAVSILTGAGGAGRRISASYKYKPDRIRTLDLAPHFSPLLRAIALRVD